VKRARAAMVGAETLNANRQIAERRLRNALLETVPSVVQKMIVEARTQHVFEKIISEAREHLVDLQQKMCLQHIADALEAANLGLAGALCDRAEVLAIPDWEPVYVKARTALKEAGVRYAAKGAFELAGRPFGCVGWRDNRCYELCVEEIHDGAEEVELQVFLIDAGEQDEMAVHVAENSEQIEELLRGYNQAVLPGFTVHAEKKGMEFVHLSFTARKGKRYFIIPSLTHTVAEASVQAGRTAKQRKHTVFRAPSPKKSQSRFMSTREVKAAGPKENHGPFHSPSPARRR